MKKKNEPRKSAARPRGKKAAPAPAPAEAKEKAAGAAVEKDPTLEEWKALYEEAENFRKLASWQWMTDENLFAMVDPESGEQRFLCVVGSEGVEFGMVVYLGEQGLRGYRETLACEKPEENAEYLFKSQKSLIATFGEADDLEKDDRRVVKALGLKPRDGCWAQFRSYRPGYLPWFLKDWEVRLLTHALREARNVAERMRKNPDLLKPPRPKALLARVPTRAGSGCKWEDKWIEPRPAPEEKPEPPDELRLRRLSVIAAHRPVVLELDFFTFDESVQDEAGSRPYIPRLILGAEQGTGHLFVFGLVKPSDGTEGLHDVFLAALEKNRFLPDEILVRSEEVRAAFECVGQRLDIALTLVKNLPAVDAAHEKFKAYAARQGRLPGD
jgi:hypothetical protein